MKTHFLNKRFRLISLFSLLLLFSCGGDGDDDDVQTVTPAPVAVVITAANLAATTPENPEAGATLGTVQASVSSGSLQYSLTSQSVAGALAINASSGAVTVADATLFDFETVQSLTAIVSITSGSVSKNVTVTISLLDVEESIATVITASDLSVSIDENPEAGASLGTIEATVNTGSLQFSLVSQSVAGALALNASTGAVTVADAALFDFETVQSLTAIVSITSGSVSENITVTISLLDVAESIQTVITASDLTATIAENPEAGASLGTIEASVNTGSLQFSLVSQSVAGALTINASTGAVTVADAALFDFETVQSLTANIRVSSGSVSEDVTVTITLTDVDEVDAGFTIWTGATLTFNKSSGGDPTLASQQDAITDNVKITRGNTGGQIYNIVTESAANSSVSPAGTEWALGTVNDIANLTFEPFRAATGGKPKDVVGQNMVLHLIADDVYISIKLTSWATGRAGGFAYERSTSN
jgi:hypothetical protein